MGSLENISIGLEGAVLLILAILAFAKPRHSTVTALGLLWLGLAAFDFLLILEPGWTTLRDSGSYILFITAMLWITFRQHHAPHP